jgi:hypothetical protein
MVMLADFVPNVKQLSNPGCLVPSSFDPGRILPPALRDRREESHWFTALVLRKAAYDDVDEGGYAHLDSRILRRAMGQRICKPVIDAMLADGVVECDGSYRSGVRCKGYKPGASYLTDRPRWVRYENASFVGRLQREQERVQQERSQTWLPIHHALESAQRGLTITDPAGVMQSSNRLIRGRYCAKRRWCEIFAMECRRFRLAARAEFLTD